MDPLLIIVGFGAFVTAVLVLGATLAILLTDLER